MISQIATFTPGQQPLVKKFILYNKGEKSLLIYQEPERDRGKKILMISDRLWQYFPKIQKTIVINSSMTVGGSVNLTDIVSSSLFQFYSFFKHEYDETSKNHILIFLSATKDSPYGLVKYFYSDHKIHYFEAYARSGILLKKIYFINYESGEGDRIYPSQVKIINTLRENDYSLIQMSSVRETKIPEYYFNPSAMDKINE